MFAIRLSATAVSVALLASCQTLSTPTTVTGTGDPAKDVAAVQAAVDRGGKVLLAGTFDFGERGRVTIKRDVQIVGEDDAVIRGGFFTFYSPVPDTLPAAAGPKIAIRDLHFVGAQWAPINIGYASGLTVTGNRIDHVKPAPLPMGNVEGGQTQAGILFGMGWAQRDVATRRYAPGVFTGRVVIADNFIDVTSAAPTRTLGYGVFGQWTTGIDATIGLNTVTGASSTSIEVIDHFRGTDGTGKIIIVNNMITTPAQGLPFPSAVTPIGVVAGYFLDRAAAVDPARSIDLEVNGNMIEDNGASSRGIWMLANDARVVANHVVTNGSSAVAIAVVGATGVIRDNVVSGNGAAAISIGTFDVLVGTRNQLVRNDLQKFTASSAHLMFGKGTSDNVSDPLASYATVADDGARNRAR